MPFEKAIKALDTLNDVEKLKKFIKTGKLC